MPYTITDQDLIAKRDAAIARGGFERGPIAKAEHLLPIPEADRVAVLRDACVMQNRVGGRISTALASSARAYREGRRLND